MTQSRPQDKSLFDSVQRIVIKVGSALLVDPQSGVRTAWLHSLVQDAASLIGAGKQVLIVSSGAIALGRTLLNMNAGPLKLDESQAAASVGQIALAGAWSDAFRTHDLVTGQILLTLHDTEGSSGRRKYLNARDTINRLLAFGAIPVINENDTLATSEIRYGDNDRLAARVATMIGADLLILLSDIDGLYTAPPSQDADAKHLPRVDTITETIEAMAGDAATGLSRGGMVTKIEAAKLATRSGTAMIIASGKRDHPVSALNEDARHTWFEPEPGSKAARKTWIAGQLETLGTLVIDDGAKRALFAGNSLLPAGVVSVSGQFQRGDMIQICDTSGDMVASGLVAYDALEAKAIIGLNTKALAQALGYEGRSAMVHRDNMALAQRHDRKDC
ncbi:MAG: glutamate 5-kinase [Pseudomonadota bacterium]